MQLFCPACQAAFPGVTRCPRCGGLLLMPHEVSPDAPRRLSSAAPPPMQVTSAGRVVVGTVLALGLYLGVRRVVSGLVLATEPDPDTWWLSFRGLLAVSVAQGLAVVFGAVVAAAGRPRGYALGLLVGSVCGGLFLGYEFLAGAPVRDLVLYLQVPVLAGLGLVGGAAGARVWQAAPAIDIPIPNPSKLSSLQLGTDVAADPGRPTAWGRVLVGALIMVIGVAGANEARLFAQKYSGGLLRVQSIGQGLFITWQLAALVVLLGGAAAGAGTGAGIRHGLLAGGLGGIAVLGICAKTGGALSPVEYWLSKLALNDLPLLAPPVIVGIAGAILLAGLLGGLLGGILFPPLVPAHLRNRSLRDE